ncbi:aminotransferase class I/II-fold pyridoxal phosphate-dependent enzyme [Puniceicoccaceae bacterium K14]|nr:aminotransferase class I/II-fold pyridoxal phosphate-dependent enzyme [Puniceicoccaceae bacterium K14]
MSDDKENKDIPYGRQCIDDADIQAVVDALKSDYITQGPRASWFEDALKEVSGAQYAIFVSSGTAALHLTILGLGLNEEHFGVVPAITFAATANCLRYVGADVRFCDTDSVSGIASAKHFETAILGNERPHLSLKALLPVSMSGRVGELEAIRKLADSYDAFVIEDAAHSIGATYTNSQSVSFSSGSCSHSDAAIYSFHPVKHVCAGEGGAILTNDVTLAKRVRALRSHGIEPVFKEGSRDRWKYAQSELGFNYRATEMQAALGVSQLKKLDGFLESRRNLARRYSDAFNCEVFHGILSNYHPDDGCSWHLYVVRFRDSNLREQAYDYLHSHGIKVQVHYIPVYHHPYYDKVDPGLFPGAEEFYGTCLSLPLYPSLSVEEQDRVIDALRLFCQSI